MEYKVVQSSHAEEFGKLVGKHLAEGWQLHGNLCIAGIERNRPGLVMFAHALTRDKDAPPEVAAKGAKRRKG